MDADLEGRMRAMLAGERFGVLATLFGGRLHTATIHFAETEQLELVHAIQPATLKAQQAEANARVAFQIDNRGILMESRERFLRVSLEGTLRRVDPDDLEYEEYRQTFAAKLPVGERLLANPAIAMYVLRPSLIRIAAGATPAEDVSVTYELEPEGDEPFDAAPSSPAAAGAVGVGDEAWRPQRHDDPRADEPTAEELRSEEASRGEPPPLDDWYPAPRDTPPSEHRTSERDRASES